MPNRFLFAGLQRWGTHVTHGAAGLRENTRRHFARPPFNNMGGNLPFLPLYISYGGKHVVSYVLT